MVDDDPGDVGLVRAALAAGRFACRMDHAVDGVEALLWLRSVMPGPRPDLILLDINMPRKNGHDVLVELKSDAVLRDIPVVMLTTSESERDIAIAYRAGAAGFVTKPADLDALFAAIDGIQAYWFGLMRLPGRGL